MNTIKVCLIFSILLSIGSVFAQDIEHSMLQRAAERVYSDMREKIPEGDAVSFDRAKGNTQVRFNRMLAEKITSDGVYRLIDRENLPKLFEENLSQQDRVFDNENAPEIGVFTPVKWMILGTVESSVSMRRLKRFHSLRVNVSVDHLETGEVLNTSQFSLFVTEQPPVWFFLVNLGVSLLTLIIVNRLTKGYYAGWLSLVFLIENVVLAIWQFFM